MTEKFLLCTLLCIWSSTEAVDSFIERTISQLSPPSQSNYFITGLVCKVCLVLKYFKSITWVISALLRCLMNKISRKVAAFCLNRPVGITMETGSNSRSHRHLLESHNKHHLALCLLCPWLFFFCVYIKYMEKVKFRTLHVVHFRDLEHVAVCILYWVVLMTH